jgi:hypothetical protein
MAFIILACIPDRDKGAGALRLDLDELHMSPVCAPEISFPKIAPMR